MVQAAVPIVSREKKRLGKLVRFCNQTRKLIPASVRQADALMDQMIVIRLIGSGEYSPIQTLDNNSTKHCPRHTFSSYCHRAQRDGSCNIAKNSPKDSGGLRTACFDIQGRTGALSGQFASRMPSTTHPRVARRPSGPSPKGSRRHSEPLPIVRTLAREYSHYATTIATIGCNANRTER